MRSFGGRRWEESLSETIFVTIMVIHGNGERERERQLLRQWASFPKPKKNRSTSFSHGVFFQSLGTWCTCEEPSVEDLWPLRVGWKRVQRYYDLLWQDVYDSEDTWEIMESPGEISDELYHQALHDVADVLDDLAQQKELLEWWPCRGTLIALMRHGARSGELVHGVDVVERDIDVMVGVASEDHWLQLGRLIETALLQRGWDRCWTKQSASEATGLQRSTRKDLLYCVRRTPAYVMLDVTSYVSDEALDDVYIHRICDGTDSCWIPAVGPLQQAAGRLAKSAIRPLQRCLAQDRPVPCPNRPLETIKAMSHSGLSPRCIALPDKALQPPGQPAGAAGAAGAAAGGPGGSPESGEVPLQLEDVELLRSRALDLDRRGFQSMLPYFSNCSTWHLAKGYGEQIHNGSGTGIT